MKPLTKNNEFVPCIIEDGDELYSNGIFTFNITKMIKYIENNRAIIDSETIHVDEYRNKSFSNINEDHLDSVDINKLIILIEINPGIYNVIDGHHRLEKFFRNSEKTIDSYKLNVFQHLQFLTTEKAYNAFIDYWNDKIN